MNAGRLVGIILFVLGVPATIFGYLMLQDDGSIYKIMLAGPALVLIGLAMLIATEFARLGPAASKLGKLVINTIAATTIFFEVIGPIGAKIALQKSGEINAKKSQAGEES